MGLDMFRRAHNTYCQRNSVIVDQSMLQFEGRPIDLHALHTEVLGHGGFARVWSRLRCCALVSLIMHIRYHKTSYGPLSLRS